MAVLAAIAGAEDSRVEVVSNQPRYPEFRHDGKPERVEKVSRQLRRAAERQGCTWVQCEDGLFEKRATPEPGHPTEGR